MKTIRKTGKAVAGSTLVETIVSMVILLSVLALFFTQIGRIDATVNPYLISRAYETSQKEMLSDDLLIKESVEKTTDGLIVRKEIRGEADNLYLVEVQVLDSKGRELYKRTKWISTKIEL